MGPWPLSLDSLVRDMNAGFGFQLICIHRDLPLLDFLHFSSCCGKNVEQMSLRGGFLFTFFQPTSSGLGNPKALFNKDKSEFETQSGREKKLK